MIFCNLLIVEGRGSSAIWWNLSTDVKGIEKFSILCPIKAHFILYNMLFQNLMVKNNGIWKHNGQNSFKISNEIVLKK